MMRTKGTWTVNLVDISVPTVTFKFVVLCIRDVGHGGKGTLKQSAGRNQTSCAYAGVLRTYYKVRAENLATLEAFASNE
eukprot:4746071-Amphidinium_carterae.1